MLVVRESVLRLWVTLAIVLTIVCVGTQLWTTDLGMDERLDGTTRVVTEVDEDGPAARAGIVCGDEIVSDPGLITYVKPWTEREIYAWNYRLKRAYETGHVTLVVRHEGITRAVDVTPDPAPSFPAGLRQFRRLAPYTPTSFAFLAVAALLAWSGRRTKNDAATDEARRAVVVSFACYGPCWIIAWPTPGWPLWLFGVSNFLDVVSATVGTASLAYFAWTYPTRAVWITRRPVHVATLAVGFATTVCSMGNALGLFDVPRALHGNATSIALDSVIALVAIAGLGWQRVVARDVVARRQASWLVGTVSVALLVPIFVLIVPQYVFGQSIPFTHYILFQFPMLMPIGVAIAVGRYRLFALDGFALRVGPYAVVTVTSLVVCITVTVGLQMVLGWRAGTTEQASRWVGLIVAIALGEPLRHVVQRFVDRTFARDRDAFLQRCSALAAKLAHAVDDARAEEEIAATLDIDSARVLALGPLLGEHAGEAVRALSVSSVLRARDFRNDALVDALLTRGIELLVALPDGADASQQALALSMPSLGPWLGRAERDALALVGRVMGTARAMRETARALEEERLRAETERRHIAMELHDGLGSTLTAARLIARRLRGTEHDESSVVDFETLEATIQQGLGDLRTSLWSLDPDDVGWDELCAKLERQVSQACAAAGVELTSSRHGSCARRLEASLRLAVLRAVQEAVTNAVKHASPRRIELSMRAADARLELVVANDGASMGADALHSGRGLGNMERRIASLGGTLTFEPRAEGGTRVVIDVPIERVPSRSAERVSNLSEAP